MQHMRLRFPSRPTTSLGISSGIALALATALISGISVFVNGYAVREFPDATLFATLKNSMVGLALVVFIARPGLWGRLANVPGRQRLGLGLLGIVGGSVPFVLFFQGLAQMNAAHAAVIHKTMFLWVALLAVIVLRERPGRAQLGAVGLLFAANLLLGGPGSLTLDSGAALVFFATLLWSLEVVLAKWTLGKVDSQLAATARMAGGAVVLLAFVTTQGQLARLLDLTVTQWLWGAGTAVLLLGYVTTWYAALQRAPATTVTCVLTLGAPITALLALLAGRPLPSPEQAVSHLVVVGAVGLLVWLAAPRPQTQSTGLAVGAH